MPSLHFGWVLLLAVAVVSLTRHRLVRAMTMATPVLMFAAIVLTGNHYIIDGIGGGLIVLSGLGIAAALRRARPKRGDHGTVAEADLPAQLPHYHQWWRS